ncbi:Dynein assembly factor with WDR repeat domains 1 [Apostasia shenzhenica]|uniref:Dynein assembly factor with WDR repeat domains 1 n=1 Tax=Apostasia shenzhenica TaxID=1088818 RepID=A0A2I0AFY6_9ASPA|nr:Dynein assembly factor with WDR repeat domains 1 [Apostasia shenzhenica]
MAESTTIAFSCSSGAGDPPPARASASIPSFSSASGSEIPSSAASASDDASDVLTHPSLPSLHSLLPPLPSSPTISASFLQLSSITPAGAGGAAALAVSPSSPFLYSASHSSLSIYDLSELRCIDAVPSPSCAGAAKSVSFSPDGATIFTAHQDGFIRVWRRSSISNLHRLVASLPTASDRLCRTLLPKNYVTVRRHSKRLWIEHADAVSDVAASARCLYSVSWDKTLKVWSASSLRCLESVAAHDDAVNAVAVAADGTVFTGSADRTIRVWIRPEGEKRHELRATLEQHRSPVNALALSPDGSVLYSGAGDRSILVWERKETAAYMAVTGALGGHDRAILSLACAGEIVVSGSADRTVRVWTRAAEGRRYSCLAVMVGHARGVRSLAAVRMPAGGGGASAGAGDEEDYRVCSGSLDGEVRVWQVRTTSIPEKLKSTSTN